jgi:protease-4
MREEELAMTTHRVRGALAALVAAGIASSLALAEPAGTDRKIEKPDKEPAAAEPAHGKRAPAVKEKVALKPKAAAKESRPQIGHIRVSGLVLSSPPEFTLFPGQASGTTLREWLRRLAKARNDSRIHAVALEIDGPAMSWAQAQEFADAVRRLNAVKPVYAHVTYGGAVSYLVASAAREVSMDPAGALVIPGLAAELMFYRGTLDWLGIQPQMIQIGRYKGAGEPFSRTGPSREFQQQYDEVLDDLYDQLCGQIARQRRLTVPHVKHVIDEAPLDAQGALKYRLVDRLVAKGDWAGQVLKKVSARRKRSAAWLAHYARKSPKQMDFSNPLQLLGVLFGGRAEQEVREPTVAIIHADGMIVPGQSGESLWGLRLVGARTITKCFRQVAEDERIKAVIFRINSPGGSGLASEMIYQAARKCAAKKPVIASIAQIGGSGGYYIALGAPKILADPSAITGSVGVLSGKLALTGLLKKIGITTHEFTRGRNAGLGLTRAWNEREQAAVRRLAQRTYDQFVSRVRVSRGRRVKDVSAVVQGRIFTARQAVHNGLIDGVGGLREAFLAAQTAAKLKQHYILTLPKPRTLIDMLYGGETFAPPLPTSPEAGALRRLTSQVPALLAVRPERRAGLAYLLELSRLMEREVALAAMPYSVTIHP